MTIRELTKIHGIPIAVKAERYAPFKVIEDNGEFVIVEYENGDRGNVLSEYITCNNYELARVGFVSRHNGNMNAKLKNRRIK
jgi:hypothetical protein